ncbi:MAG: hypothetical protein M3Q07_06435 [Pseudobdellovibrionaceae bacterium]|nr:hypothetical protein [Pseudobdellovibrionaceae bacterium]
MSLQSIQNTYLLSLDAEGNILYKEMRQAEDRWIAATNYPCHDLGNRTRLLIAHGTRLPSLDQMVSTRNKFRQYLMARKQALEAETSIKAPDSIGIRSTALPEWLLPDRKIPVDIPLKPKELDSIHTIKVRRQMAWRSALLKQNEVLEALEHSIQKTQQSIQNALKNRNTKRAQEAQLRLQEMIQDNIQILELFKIHGLSLTARIHSGHATKILIKSKDNAWTTSIANVGLVRGSKDIKVILENPETRIKTIKLAPVASIGRFVFYQTPEHGLVKGAMK